MSAPKIDYCQYDREQLIRFLRLRDRQALMSRDLWVRAAKEALLGNASALRNRVDMAEAEWAVVVLSEQSPKPAA